MNNPLVSVILPIKKNFSAVERCLVSIKDQTYKNIEIYIISSHKDPELENLVQSFGYHFVTFEKGKNASRNKGAELSNGKYLIHLDDDMFLASTVVEECVNLAETQDYRAIAIKETEERTSGLYNVLRILEKQVASHDLNIEAPRFIEKETYFSVGGIDVNLDPIDEGDLKAKLEENNISHGIIKSGITLSGKNRMSSLHSRWYQMYKRGEKLSLFNTFHPNSSQLKPIDRSKAYFKKYNIVFKNPLLGILLVLIKTIDLLCLKLGSLNISPSDKRLINNIKNKRIFENESNTYQKEFFEGTIGAQYVDRIEKEFVQKYLVNINKNAKLSILDIGPGGGRWSELMLNHFPNAEVSACDLSAGMVEKLNARFIHEKRFKAYTGDMQQLPFDDESFDLIISIRAVKYAPDQIKLFSEISRVLKIEGVSIIELPYLNFIYRFIKVFNIFGKISEYANRIVLLEKKIIEQNILSAKLKLINLDIFSTIPATFYKNTNSKITLNLLAFFDSCLPEYIFGRSIFVKIEKKKIKVGINSRIYQGSNTGIPYYIKCLYENLIVKHKEYDYTFFQTNAKKTLGETHVYNGPRTGIVAGLFDLFLINSLIKKGDISIFHGPSNILPFFKIKGIKYIVTIHDLSFLIFPENHSFLFTVYYKYGIKRSLKNADEIIAISENTKNDIIKYYGIEPKKIKVIYSGVNNIFLNEQSIKRIVLEKYFFSITTHPVRKNILSVIRLMNLHQNLKIYKFVIAGLFDKEQLEILNTLINDLNLKNNVVIWGYASESELVSLYKHAEFFIYPSFYEGFGFPIIEAMASKTSVIGSNNSSMKELVLDKNYLVDPYDLNDIYSKIEYTINRPTKLKNKEIQTNFEFAKKFNWEDSSSKFVKLL